MKIKMKWRSLLTGFFCMILLACNAGSVFAEDTDIYNLTVSGNDISGNDSKGESGETETEENVTDKNGGEEPGREPDTEKSEAVEDLLQPLSLEMDGYDISAADRTYTAGENIMAYYFEADGVLLFEGNGAMTEWGTDKDVPWVNETVNTAIIGEGITTVGAYALCYHAELSEVSLPSTLKIIGDYAICETYSSYQTKGNLRNVDIPDSVEKIGDFAFRGNALETIRIPDSVSSIGNNAFACCRDATSLSIGAGVTDLKERAFAELTGIATLVVPGNIETIKEYTFFKTGATEIIISEGVKVIENYAFTQCEKVERITFGNSVESIGSHAFSQCKKLKTLAIPDSVVQIGNAAFESCHSLTDLTFGSGLESIDGNAFNEAYMLEHIEIPDNVTWIGSSAFHDSRSLKEISIGRGITRLGYGVFMVNDEIETTVVTENNTVIQYGWENDRRKVIFKSEVIFKDHAGNILRNMILEHGDTVLDKAPDMGDFEDQGYTYIFTGWLPEITDETKVTGGAEYIAQYDSDAPKTVTFMDYDGSIILQKTMEYNSPIFPIAPIPQRADSGCSSYTFQCWSPALNETDILTKDITYTALYRRKTQTGIQIRYKGEMMEGTPVSAETITVYPVYRVFDENNKLIEMIWDDKAVIGADDLRFSKDYLERGSNEILIEQISTGLTITADIFGSYIDGIAVWQPPKELEAGTELRELDVYYTRTIEDKAGFIENNLPDLTKKVEKYELDKKDSVIIKEGDNEISVTEKESGKEYEDIIHITGIPKKSGDGGDDTKKDPEEDVSGNDPSDKKDETTSGNDPTDKKDDTTSGNDPADKKDETTSGNDPADKKEEKPSDGADDPGNNAGGGSDGKDKEPDVNINISVTDTDTTKPESGRHHSNFVTADDSEPDTTGKEQDLTDLPDDEYAIRKTGKPVKTGDEAYAKLLVTAAIGLACVVLLILLCGITEAGSYIAFFTGRIFFRKNRKGFHGILTKTENPYLTVDAPENMTETVQDVIDRTGSIEECIAELKKSGAVTYLPSGTRITVFYTGKDDALETIHLKADEDKLFAILKELPEKGKIMVQFTNEAAKLNMKLRCQK